MIIIMITITMITITKITIIIVINHHSLPTSQYS